MEPDGSTGSIIIAALALIKAFFTAAEAAVTEINDSKLKSFEHGSRAERRLFLLLKNPSRLITAFAVHRIFSAALIAYVALIAYFNPLNGFFAKLYGGAYAEAAAFVTAAALILLVTVLALTVFCDGLPKKTVNQSNACKLAVFCSLPVKLLVAVLTPLTALSSLLVNVIARIFGIKASDGDSVTEEEILMMVDAGNETGVIEESQKEMINNVFEFNELTASDVMTHRTDVVGVEASASVSEVVNASISSGFSRIPVYENSIDRIIGIICVKDLLCMVGSDAASTASARDFLRDIIYVPETISCGELFKQLTAKHMQMAVAADEYGGTAGIVTMEDVVESIVGNIQDEYDDEAEDIIKISDDTYTIDGTAAPERIFEELGAPLPDGGDFDTVSGFIVSLLGRIPEENESPCVRYKNIIFTVLIVEDMCITKLKATVINDKNDENIKSKENSDDEHQEKISLILAVLMSVSMLATGCKKTDEDTDGLSGSTTTAATEQLPELTEMTSTTAAETEAAETEATTTVPETEAEPEETTTEETTAAETTTASETAAVSETTAATTAAAAKRDWNETELSEIMYTSQACYSRVKPVVGADPVSQYKKGVKVNITAATDTGYYKLADGSFIHADYLTDEKPSASTTKPTYDDDDEEIFDDEPTGNETEKPSEPSKPEKPAKPVTSSKHNVDHTARYAYKTLNASEKKLYDRIYEAAASFETKVDIPDGLLSDDVIKIYCMVFNQEPQFFWLSTKVPSGYGSIKLKYELTPEQAAEKQKQIDKTVDSLMASANKCSTTAGKLKVFYDWIIKNNDFSLSENASTCSISNGLVGGGVLQCAGYAKSMQYLCDIAGIDSTVIVGKNRHGSSHAWNVVYCGDGYYILDTTWGDPEGAPGGRDYIRYSFFLVPDKWTTNTHFNINYYFKSNGGKIKFFDPPACTKTTYNYYKIYGKEYSDLESATQGMYNALDEAIKNGKYVAEIRVTDSKLYEKLVSDDYAVKFQKYAKDKGDVAKLSRQKADNEGGCIVQYNIVYN